MIRLSNDIWAELKPKIDARLNDLSPEDNEVFRLRDFRGLAESFIAGNRIGSRGSLAEMLYGEARYNGLLSTPDIDGLAGEFAIAAEKES